jgi:predicted ATPase
MKTQFIAEVQFRRDKVESFDEYPFCLHAVKNLKSLVLHPAVTFLVGENGSGKSTLLEAMAAAWGFNPEGGTKNFNFSTRSTHSSLHDFLLLVKGVQRPKDGFFLRAESFYNVASQVDDLFPKGTYGERSFHEQSHGESFMDLMLNRFQGNSLFMLDEPEAALSPTRQMSMIARMHDLVKENSQFIIATHSPIIMAYPNAHIYVLEEKGIERLAYEDTEHFQITKTWMNEYQKMLDTLMED